MFVPENVWPSLITGLATLAGVTLTLRLSNKNQAAAREHDRTMARELREHERQVAALEHRQEVYESFLAAVDATQHAVGLMYSARQVGKNADADSMIMEAVTTSTKQLYRAHSLLDLYASPDVAKAGMTLFALALEVQSAFQNYRQWQIDLVRFRDQFATAVRSDIDPLIRGEGRRANQAILSDSTGPASATSRPNGR